MIQAYTYLIKIKSTGQHYYGSRYKNIRLGLTPEEDLMISYPTSSRYIKAIIKQYGKESLEWKIRRKFNTPKEAVKWETKVLRRCKVLQRPDIWLNKNVAGHIMPTPEGNKKISDFHKDKPKTEEHKQKISASLKGRPVSPSCLTAEYRANMSKLKTGEGNGMYGKQQKDETKKLIGEKNRVAQLAKGEDHHMKKIEWTDEKRKAMGDKSRGKVRLQSAIDAASAKLRGRKRETKYCPYCDKNIAIGWYNRHGENCKQKGTINV